MHWNSDTLRGVSGRMKKNMAWKSEGKGLNNDSGRVEITRDKALPNKWEMKLTDAGVTATAVAAAVLLLVLVVFVVVVLMLLCVG